MVERSEGKGKKKETKNGKDYDYRTDSVTFAKIQAPATATYKHTPSTPHIRLMFCRTIGAIRCVWFIFHKKKKGSQNQHLIPVCRGSHW